MKNKLVLSIFLLVFSSISSTSRAEDSSIQDFKDNLAAIKELTELDDGYHIDVDLARFENKPESVEIKFLKNSVNIIVYPPIKDAKTFSSVTKSYNLNKPVSKNNAQKTVENGIAKIFIPFASEEEIKASNSSENFLPLAKKNMEETLKKGVEYYVHAERAGNKLEAKIYHKGNIVRTEKTDGTYTIMNEEIENGRKKISWYSSSSNQNDIQYVKDGDKFEMIYIDSPENYPLYVKEKSISVLELPCDVYVKKDINEEIKVCVNIDTGIVLHEEKVGKYKKEITNISIGEVPEEKLTIPEGAERVNHW